MAALAGHRAVVLRLLRHRQPSEAEKIRCARYALRGGHTDVAALVAPPALSKTIVRTPSQVYAATGVLEPFTMRDGFYDASVPAVRRKTESLFLCLFCCFFFLTMKRENELPRQALDTLKDEEKLELKQKGVFNA